MDALQVHQVMSYHPLEAAGSYKGHRTIYLWASMPVYSIPLLHTHTHTHSLPLVARTTYLRTAIPTFIHS